MGLFVRKPLAYYFPKQKNLKRIKKTLTSWSLVALISTIGAGLSITGMVAANYAGPGIMISLLSLQ